MNSVLRSLNVCGDLALSWAWPMLWQSSLIIVVVLALNVLLRNKVRAAVCYALWMIVLLKLVVPPSLATPTGLGWWLRPPAQVAEAPARSVVTVSYAETIAPPLLQKAESAAGQSGLNASGAAFAVWSLVCLGLVARMAARWLALNKVARDAAPATEWLARELEAARSSPGLNLSLPRSGSDHY